MADEPNPEDRLLLARLNALKQSTISLDPSTTPLTPTTTTTNANPTPQDLLLRFQQINNKNPLSTPNPPSKSSLPTDSPEPQSPTLDDLLAELGPTDHWTLDPTDATETQALLAEAARALPTTTTTVTNPIQAPRQQPTIAAQRVTNDSDNDEAEAASSLQRILDEVHHEQQQQQQQNPASPPPPTTSAPIDSFAALIFPSPPSTSLTLPSAPTTAPTARGANDTGANGGFRDEEIDSWCGICCADAAVKCFGCEGERYCWGCWREGHVGPDAGMVEKTHVWERVKGRRKRVG